MGWIGWSQKVPLFPSLKGRQLPVERSNYLDNVGFQLVCLVHGYACVAVDNKTVGKPVTFQVVQEMSSEVLWRISDF